MRVIAGSAKKARLFAPNGTLVRPTSDRIKETLFNMIGDVGGLVFLDLFAGSGAIGIEALSRGAKKAVFVERDRDAVACIRKNLAHTRLTDAADVLPMDVRKGLERIRASGIGFDLVFLDPPYDKGIERKVLEDVHNMGNVGENARIIVETSLNTSIDYLEDFQYHIERVKTYKTNQHVFITKAKGTGSEK